MNLQIDFECIFNENGTLALVENATRLKRLWSNDEFMDYSWNQFITILKIQNYLNFPKLSWDEFVLKITNTD